MWEIASRGIYSRVVSDLKDDWGHAQQLHRLRQMRAGLPHRRACGEGLRRSRDGQAKRSHHPPGGAQNQPSVINGSTSRASGLVRRGESPGR